MSAKYKAHKLVNVFFYLIVFFVGVLIGLGAKSFNFSRIMSQFLMIDNVEAYSATVPMNNSYKVTSSNYYDEEKLYNLFNYVFNDSLELGFDFTDYQYVYSLYASNSQDIFYCPESMSIGGNSNKIWFNSANYGCYRIYQSSSSFMISNEVTGSNYSKDSYYMASTVDHSSLMDSRFKKVLDFTDFLTVNLEFDENLFSNDENFKEVCVNNFDTFSITSNHIQDYDENDNPYLDDLDFIWIKGNLNNIRVLRYIDLNGDISVSQAHNVDDVVSFYTPLWGHVYFLDSSDTIKSLWTPSPFAPGAQLTDKNYVDKFKYYGYSFVPFNMYMSSERKEFLIFHIEDEYITDLDGNDSYNSQLCFYIKKEYDVSLASRNLDGTYVFNINVLKDDNSDGINYTTGGMSNLEQDYTFIFSRISSFLNQIRGSIDFINTNIYNFYLSFGTLLRLFIDTFIIILLVKFIVNMIVR